MNIPTDTSDAFKLVDSYLQQVKESIYGHLAQVNDTVGRLLKNFDICSGKMIRPAMVLLAGRCCGQVTDKHIFIAAIIEIIHNATLLHDDVVDEGQKRRDVPTINSLWGNESAVLLGDFLFSKACLMSAELEPQISKIVAVAMEQICQGELSQIANRQNWNLTETEYTDIIIDKSASLFRTSCYLGAVLADADKSKTEAMADFGLNTGIAFQITDDLLDITADESETGKTGGRDIDKNKLTLSVIHLLKAADENQKSEIIDRLKDNDIAYLSGRLREAGSFEYTINRARKYVETAIEALSVFGDSDTKDVLIETARAVARRVD